MKDKQLNKTKTEKEVGEKLMSEEDERDCFLFDYYEVSAKTGKNVKECINLMVEEVITEKYYKKRKKKNNCKKK